MRTPKLLDFITLCHSEHPNKNRGRQHARATAMTPIPLSFLQSWQVLKRANEAGTYGYWHQLSLSSSQMPVSAAVIFIPLGIALLLAALVIRMRDARFRRTSLRAKATIIDRREFPYEDTIREATSFRFIDSKGEETVTGIDSLSSLSTSGRHHYVGQDVEVLYDPEYPYTRVRFSDSSVSAIWTIRLGETGVLCLFFGLLSALTLH
ncbi:DUF3592 domain-containing protein [Candidatus Bathyarchaeota archaeon]|nr:DUF3592 domain-containing protein [Candidatus Bathyarchaeota archaeon]